jgi:hypothetical protein
MKHFSLTTNFSERIFQFWWLLLIGGFIGGIIAFITAFILISPVYLAEAKMSIVINFKEVGHLSQYEQDQMIGNVINLFETNEIVEPTVALINDDNVSITEFRNSCFIERQVNTLFFRCVSNNSSLSQKWANNWAKNAYEKLSEAYGHALMYEKLKRVQDTYESCVERSYFVFPTSADCQKILPDQTSLEQLADEIEYERLLSKNIFPGFKFSEIILAEQPQKIVRNNTNAFVLSGSLFGFLLTLGFLYTKKNESK